MEGEKVIDFQERAEEIKKKKLEKSEKPEQLDADNLTEDEIEKIFENAGVRTDEDHSRKDEK